MILFGGTIYIPSAYDLYCSLIIDLLITIINLENDYLGEDISEEKKDNIVKKIKSNLKLIGFFLEDKKNEDYINIELPIDINKNIVSFQNTIIDNYVNPLVVFVSNFKLNWVKYNLITIWEKNGGNYENLYGSRFIVKKDIVFFINELEKNLYEIDKDIIKKYIGKLYDSIDNNNLRLKLNTFQVYSVIKNNINSRNLNKISRINESDFIKLDKYYKLGINVKLIKIEEINRIYNTYERYYEEILPDTELTPFIINKYVEFLEIQDKNFKDKDKDKKISNINTKYYSYLFNNFLKDKNYKNHRDDIIACYNFLKTLNYNFKKEQSDKVKLLNVKLNCEGKIPFVFNADNYFPLFYYDELCKLKNDILENKDNLCAIIKKTYPMYNISYDLFCKIEPSGQKKYLDKETMNKTVNFYCVVFLIIGIVNFQLKKYDQDYMIILKGGKALQLILSGMNFKDNTIFKSNDIDLIITSAKGKKYFQNKCKYLGINICLLIQWILNTTKNMYNKDYYIDYKLPDKYDTYQYIIKLSHKIQYSNDNTDLYHTALADFDFNEITEKKFYSNLIVDTKNSNSVFGELLYIYQNLSNFLLEKIYYININAEFIDKNIDNKTKINQDKINIMDKIDLLLIEIEKNKKSIEEVKINNNNNNNDVIKKYNDLIIINNKKINDYDIMLKKIELERSYFKIKKNQLERQQENQYNLLISQIDIIRNYNINLTNQIDKLEKDNKINNDKIKNLHENELRLKKDFENDSKILKIIKNDIYKISLDETNAKRFIKKFSNQIKFASELIIKNESESESESDVKTIFLDKQKEYIKKIIGDNKQLLEFDDMTIENIIQLIFLDNLDI